MTNKTTLWRGIKERCPKCGQGQLFQSYIKQNDHCAICHEDFSTIRADDAPPWLTILITGHIVAPWIFFFVRHEEISEFWEVLSLALFCVFTILPRAKGFFIAAIWLTRQKNPEREEEENSENTP